MNYFKILFLAEVAAVLYGIVNDLVTIHICPEYFTVAHPPVFPVSSSDAAHGSYRNPD